MTSPPPHVQFVRGGQGRILAVMFRPPEPSGRAVLIAPPFAEEMNKSRKMLADVGRGLCVQGTATILVDPYGTGDSEGEFRDATWAGWKEDLVRTAEWAANEGWPVEALLCVRLGCLLGAEVARALGGIRRTVFWQPVAEGERFLTQFLRLRVAASMMDGPRESVGQLRQTLSEGRPVEVAGYELGPDLAAALSGLSLADALERHLGILHWMEVVRDREASMASGSAMLIDLARTRGLEVHSHTFVGEPFWVSTEIVRVPDLLDCTIATLAAIPLERVGPSGEQRSEARA